MLTSAPRLLPKARWVLMLLGLAAIVAWTGISNRPFEERLDRARQSLAEAGFPNARVQRGQSPTNLSRCHVGQLRNRGYAYAWTAGEARGLLCLPVDGRPTQINVDRGEAD